MDAAGNVYIADGGNSAMKKWTVANSTLTTLVSSGLSYPEGVAVDRPGNVYIAHSDNHAIKELPHAFVDLTARLETAVAGSDTLPVVLPATANLLAPFAPTSDHWLTITGVSNGVVTFAFGGNTAGLAARLTSTLLGQTIAVTQQGPTYTCGTTALLKGPAEGTDSAVLAVNPEGGIWAATANAGWLHLSAENQSGTGSMNVVFSYDANPGATRTGTLTIAGHAVGRYPGWLGLRCSTVR